MRIAEFQDLVRNRYLATDQARGSSGTFVWFIEEVGELASAIGAAEQGRDNRANLEEEFADVFAWLCTLANIHGIDLTEAVGKYTLDGGPKGTKA